MKRPLAALALASALAAGCQSDPVAPAAVATAVPSFARRGAGTVPGQYLVLLRVAGPTAHAEANGGSATGVAALAEQAVARVGGGRAAVRRTYHAAVTGFAAELTEAEAAALRADPAVALVEPDPVVTASATQTPAPWGLDRIDQTALPLDGRFTYPNAGAGVSVYILDSGIRLDHAEFGGRAVAGYDFVTAGGTAGDCHGHGTHVAGTIGGATYGVAKAARLVALRVLDCGGNGSGSGLISALDYVVQQKRTAPGTPMVVNMSLGGGASSVIDQAVQNAVAAGVTVVVAAGNESADACTKSPARAPNAITVGATASNDGFAAFSNRGTCVDLSAPGVSIVSAGIASTTAAATMSGTSMAAPHAAGAAALYLGANPSAAPAQVAAALVGNAGRGVGGLPAGTPDRLLGIGFLNAAAAPAPLVNVALAGQASGRCLDADGSRGAANGATAQLWACFGNVNQAWTLPPVGVPGEVRVWGGMCLDDDMGGWRAGDKVHVWTCLGNANQVWTRTPEGQLRGANNMCVTPLGGATSDGTRLVLAPCAADRADQRWIVR